LKEEFGITNNMAVPKLAKIVINTGAGDIKDNQAILDKLLENIATLSGQKGVPTRAKKSVAAFKLSKGQTIGIMATLRGDRMYDFLDKLLTIVLPKVRDFRGVSRNSFDGWGSYTLGLSEMAIFPEIEFENASPGKIRGLAITIVTTAKNKAETHKLLELLGMPFRKG